MEKLEFLHFYHMLWRTPIQCACDISNWQRDTGSVSEWDNAVGAILRSSWYLVNKNSHFSCNKLSPTWVVWLSVLQYPWCPFSCRNRFLTSPTCQVGLSVLRYIWDVAATLTPTPLKMRFPPRYLWGCSWWFQIKLLGHCLLPEICLFARNKPISLFLDQFLLLYESV